MARLSTLYESINMGIFAGMAMASVKGPETDDSNQLVAYRVYMMNRAQHIWVVNFKGQPLANISRHDSRWVHDNWDYHYCERPMQTIMTAENRKYLDQVLFKLRLEIMDAIRERRADVVVMPLDVSKL